MATIIVNYDARNSIAKKLLDLGISLGVFKIEKKITGIDEALEDIRKGRVFKAKNAKDLIDQCLK